MFKFKESKSGKSATPAMKYSSHDVVSGNPDTRVIVEICCGKDSRIGRIGKELKDCQVIRITEEEDFRLPSTVSHAARFAKSRRSMVFISLPCTGGTPWQHINKKRPGGMTKWRKHMKLFYELWKSVDTLFSLIDFKNTLIVIEGPEAVSCGDTLTFNEYLTGMVS